MPGQSFFGVLYRKMKSLNSLALIPYKVYYVCNNSNNLVFVYPFCKIILIIILLYSLTSLNRCTLAQRLSSVTLLIYLETKKSTKATCPACRVQAVLCTLLLNIWAPLPGGGGGGSLYTSLI